MDAQKLAAQVVALAQERNLTLVTAESCTAGLLTHILSLAAGAGDILHGGFVTYTKDNKTKALGVSSTLLATETAVSRKVAEAMAIGALERSPADMALAVTGVTGPEPDEDGNPVGLVYVAVARRGGVASVREHRLGQGSKHDLGQAAMRAVLELALASFQA
jgi:nicotinamide-nucleotide amidase